MVGGIASPHPVDDQGARDTVIMSIDIDVVIERNDAFLHGEHARRWAQSAERASPAGQGLEDAAP